MTPREIILANIDADTAPRCGMTFSDGRIDDILCCGISDPKDYNPRRWTQGNLEYYDDVWGNTWARMVGGSQKGEVHKAVLDDWADMAKLKVPDYTNPLQYERMRKEFEKANGRFRMAFMGGWVFNDARYIRKLEVYLCDMALYPDELKRLHKQIAGVYEAKIRGAAAAGADGIWVLEDLGTQNGPLFSPEMFRDYFKPEYSRLWGIAHELGMKVFMHSCGNNAKLLDDLIEAGVDCFQFDQPLVYDVEMLSKKFREKHVALWSPVDIQKVLPTGDKDLIIRETERMLTKFKGRMIMKNYPDLPGIGVKPEWDMWAYETALRLNKDGM
jgi:uroporphyrinogen decarboxylase